MKSCFLILKHAGLRIEIIESPMLSQPWPAENGKMSYRVIGFSNDNKVYVHDIYAYFFQLFNISDATRLSCSVAVDYLNKKIDSLCA